MAAKLPIPESVADMQDIMNSPRRAAEYIQSGQFAEIVDAYRKATTPDFAVQVKDQLTAFFEGQGVIDDKVESAVSNALKQFGVNRPPAESPTPGTGAKQNAAFNPEAPGAAMNDIGFANAGDFARAIWHKNPKPDARMDRVRQVMNDFSSVDPSAGGFLIPETMRSEILQLSLETAVVRPRATVITMTTLRQLLPFVDWTTNVGSVFGGFVFYWTGEAEEVTFTQAKFGRLQLEARKLMGLAGVPNELFNDAPALSSWINQSLPRGLSFYEDVAFLNGGGGDEPLGALNAPACVVVTKETNQPASTIVVENVLNMYSRMLPSSLGSAVWVANQTTFTQLMTLSIAVGTGGAPVALVDIHSSPQMTMLGRPLIITEKVPSIGNQGDLNFIDFSYYMIGDRQAVSIETSEHALFTSDKTALKVIERVDGRPWIQSAFTPLNGLTVSPIVSLGAR